MNIYVELLERVGGGLLQLVANPFYYVGVLFIVLQYRRQMQMERKLFHVRLHGVIDRVWRTVLWGAFGGLLATLAMAFVGAVLQPASIWCIWILSLVMILFRVRFLCMAYSVGVIALLHSVLSYLPDYDFGGAGILMDIAAAIRNLDAPALLAVVAILHLLEAIFVRYQGEQGATPLFFEGKRGKIVGGYQLQQFWPVPLLFIVPMSGGSGVALPWSPLLGGDLWSHGWTILAFPIVMGFSEQTMTRLPKAKAVATSKMLALYALILLVFVALAELWPVLTVVAAMASILLHEAVIWYSRWDESRRSPMFVHGPSGLKILAVLPQSPAEGLGLQAGEIVHKVNGVKVRTKEEMHQALRINSAFCKMEVLNLEGHSKFVQRAMFSGEHHQLGLILSPDADAMYYVATKETHLFTYLKAKLGGLNRNEKNFGA